MRSMTSSDHTFSWRNGQHSYEVRPRKDRRGVDLMSDVQDAGRLSAR